MKTMCSFLRFAATWWRNWVLPQRPLTRLNVRMRFMRLSPMCCGKMIGPPEDYLVLMRDNGRGRLLKMDRRTEFWPVKVSRN